jgi:hypothetical protein
MQIILEGMATLVDLRHCQIADPRRDDQAHR